MVFSEPDQQFVAFQKNFKSFVDQPPTNPNMQKLNRQKLVAKTYQASNTDSILADTLEKIRQCADGRSL